MSEKTITHFIFFFDYKLELSTISHDAQILSTKYAKKYYEELKKDPQVINLEVYAVTAHFRCRFKEEEAKLEKILEGLG